jgi:hypothetical protein
MKQVNNIHFEYSEPLTNKVYRCPESRALGKTVLGKLNIMWDYSG